MRYSELKWLFHIYSLLCSCLVLVSCKPDLDGNSESTTFVYFDERLSFSRNRCNSVGGGYFYTDSIEFKPNGEAISDMYSPGAMSTPLRKCGYYYLEGNEVHVTFTTLCGRDSGPIESPRKEIYVLSEDGQEVESPSGSIFSSNHVRCP